MADHAVTQSCGVAHSNSAMEPASKVSASLSTPLSQASTAPDISPHRTWSLGSSDFDQDKDATGDHVERVLAPDDLPTLLLSRDPVAESYFIDTKEEFVRARHCPDSFDMGVFELISETHTPSKDTMMRFSSVATKPINVFSSSRAESACKGEASLLEDDELALWLLSGSPAAMSSFLDVNDEFVKMRHGPDEFDLGVFELLSEAHVPSKDAIMRFSSGMARPISIFSSSRAEAACKGETSLLEDADFALWLLSGSPAAVSYFHGTQEECVKTCHGSDAVDWRVFELLSEVQTTSGDIISQFSSAAARPNAVYSSSRAEAACKGEISLLEADDLTLWLLLGSPAAVAYFMGAQEEHLQTFHHQGSYFDWDVLELLSEAQLPRESVVGLFSPGMDKPINRFSSARADFACQFVAPSFERDD